MKNTYLAEQMLLAVHTFKQDTKQICYEFESYFPFLSM